MINAAIEYNADLVIMNSFRRYPLGFYKKQRNNIIYNTPKLNDEIIKNYYISFFGINKISVTCWGKLIRTEIVRQSKFQYGKIFMGEDLLFNLHLFPLLHSMVGINYYGYNWRFGGFTSSKKTIEQVKKVISEFLELYRIKSQLAHNINYEKAILPMAIELKNVLQSNLSSIAKYPDHDNRSKNIKDLISELIKIDDYYQNISNLLRYEEYANDNFIKAVSNNNVDAIYEICHEIYKKNWKKRFVKKILNLLT